MQVIRLVNTFYTSNTYVLSCEGSPYVFTGDSYIPEIKGKALFPNSNRMDAKASYERLEIISQKHHVCPGHGSCLDKQ